MFKYKFGLLALAILTLSLPVASFALDCSSDGYSVVFVNGVLNSPADAEDSRYALSNLLLQTLWKQPLTVKLGYNASHLAGYADFIQSGAQTLGGSVSDYDLNTILTNIYPQVTTRKILLVGHSQGTFYTNTLYSYLISHGVPKEDISVYNLATPANYVAGGGTYLTSANDRLILKVREIDAEVGVQGPLTANILIPLPESELNDEWGGHHFESDYLGGASNRIVSDITKALGNLKTTPGTAKDGCFDPPLDTAALKAQKAFFDTADPLTLVAVTAVGETSKAIAAATQKAYAAASTFAQSIAKAVSSFTLKPTVTTASQGAAAALAIPSAPTSKPLTTNTPAVSIPPSPPSPVSVPAPQSAPTNTSPTAPPPTVPSFDPFSVPPSPAGGAPAVATQSAIAVVVPLAVTSPSVDGSYATTSVTFSGTTTPGFVVAFAYGSNATSTVADTNGSWSATLTLQEGATAVGVVASDADGNTSDAITRNITVDTTPPAAPVPAIAECSAFGAGYCEILATTASLSWAPVSDASYYVLTKNSSVTGTTTDTSAQFSLTSNATTTFSVAAYDSLGNGATSTDVSVFVKILPPIFPPLLLQI